MSEYQRKHRASSGESSHDADFSGFSEPSSPSQFSRRQAREARESRVESSRESSRGSNRQSEGSGGFKRSRSRRAGAFGSTARETSQDAFVGYSVDDVKRKPRPIRTIVTAVVAVIIVGALVFGGYKLLSGFGLFGTPAASSVEVAIFIPEGSTTTEIAMILKDKKVISTETRFIQAVKERGVDNRLQPGKYTMHTGMTDNDAIDILMAGPNPDEGSNKLTIPEGLTLESTAAIVEKSCGIPAADFIAEAKSADKYVADYPFLEGVYNNSMEGFLYPKTYSIPEGSNAEYVIRVLLDQFAKETANLDLSYAEERNLNLFDVMIIASMIEKETAAPDERPLVSSVIYNRLHQSMKLQICATVVYAIGLENYDGHPLLETDLEIDSPYNTYLVDSLPAGPICSPHISSIEAAAHPSETDYLFYVLTSQEGTHTFCTNEEEFEVANAAYHELFGVPN